MKQAIVSVTSDITTDQRVHRSCLTLGKLGYDVILVGRKKKNSSEVSARPYEVVRFSLPFEKGFLFYASYNLRLFFFLLSRKPQLFFSNDLDSLLPNFLTSRIKSIPLIYDSHEFYTETPELVNRKVVRKVWLLVEGFVLNRLKAMITVSDSIAAEYAKRYGLHVSVVRNIPMTLLHDNVDFTALPARPEGSHVLLYQGAGINVDRGLEELISSMQYVQTAVLWIVGGGDVMDELKLRVAKLQLSGKVFFIGKVSPAQLKSITPQATLALSLDKTENLNYKFSLPNKLFDYIQAGVPVLASETVEVKKVIEKYLVGEFIQNHDPKHIAERISAMLADKDKLRMYQENAVKCASALTWEEEEKQLVNFIERYSKV